jgi:glutaconyl-CoA/methylmalonyl-CoA decarboxylase subunit gamma
MKLLGGQVGELKIDFLSLPQAQSGEVRLRVNGEELLVKYVRDLQGITLDFGDRVLGVDWRLEPVESGLATYTLVERNGNLHAQGVRFKRDGEELLGTGARSKKGGKLKSQMPGKILKVLVKDGDAVVKGQPLLVMEAMKMENEMKAQDDAVVRRVLVEAGATIEAGAELIYFG